MLNEFNNIQVSFHGSILGFENLNQFVLESVDDTPFAYLNSVEDSNISFLVTSPFYWYRDYQLELGEALKQKLKLVKPEDALVVCTVTIKNPSQLSTINLLAPLIINIKECAGSQYVFHEQTSYRTNSPLMKENVEGGGD